MGSGMALWYRYVFFLCQFLQPVAYKVIRSLHLQNCKGESHVCRLHGPIAEMFLHQKNQFTRSFTLEAIRKNLVWRLDNLWPPPEYVPMSNVHCLPPTAADPFGRPIIIVETVPVEVDVELAKKGVLQFFERVRSNLYELAKEKSSKEDIPLQCMVVIDLTNLSFQRAVCFLSFAGVLPSDNWFFNFSRVSMLWHGPSVRLFRDSLECWREVCSIHHPF